MTTFDLHTGFGRAPDPADYITKKSGCPAAPLGTSHPVWTEFLERIAPDPELRAFLQRYIGYCCTGVTREHKFAFAYGTGANGKSTFTNTILGIFGDYATVADVGTFIASNHERHPTDLAKLHGYRLVVAQETEKGRRWDEVQDQDTDRRRQDDRAIHAAGLLRLCAEVQAMDCRQSQATAR